jgi:hypothetical protein
VAAAPVLGAVSQVAVPVPGSPFSVVAAAGGRWSVVMLNSAVEVLARVQVGEAPVGLALSGDGGSSSRIRIASARKGRQRTWPS